MTTIPQDYATEASHRLITQVAGYYNNTLRDLELYRELDSSTLVKLSQEHLQDWKNELRSLIFNGMNCTDKRSA